jgi:hypothetical protein
MALEATGNWAEAKTLYEGLLEQMPTNGPILKRKAAVERSMGNPKGAIEALNDYLTVYVHFCTSQCMYWCPSDNTKSQI